jgi:hypothetical protein
MEIGNKPSFMGVYTAGIVVASLPAVLPRLSAYLWVVTPIDRPLTKFSFQVLRDDGTLLFRVEPTESSPEAVSLLSNRPDTTRRAFMAGFSMGGVELPLGCRYLSLRVVTESETLEAPKLYVEVNEALMAQFGLSPRQSSGTTD